MSSDEQGWDRTMVQRWRAAVADGSGTQFTTQAAEGVTLAGSVFLRPITGRHEVWTALHTAAQIYDHLDFTHTGTVGRRTYLEWEAVALGQAMAGVTVLGVNDDNLFELVAIHHRPLSAALSFSIEMRHRLIATMDPTFFYRSAGSKD